MADDPLIYWTTIGANVVTIAGALYGIPRVLKLLGKSAAAAERTAVAQERLARAAETERPMAHDWSLDLVYKMDATAADLEREGKSAVGIADALRAGLLGNATVLERIDRMRLKSAAMREVIEFLDTEAPDVNRR